jgi:ABC-type uncharacterized transport system substrate-binding protein
LEKKKDGCAQELSMAESQIVYGWLARLHELRIAPLPSANPVSNHVLMRYFHLLKLGLFLLLAVLWTGIAFAHPHVWVTMETEVVLGPDKEITGFRHKWTFDEGYTNFAIDGLDTNGDGIYSEEELKPLAQTNIEALKEFEYFTFAFIGETKLPTKAPVDYRLDYKDKLLTLTFTLPLEKPIAYEKIKDFSFAVYDPGMYVSLTFNGKQPVRITSVKPIACGAHIGDRDKAKAKVKETTLSQLGENIDPSSNIGYQYAERVTIQCKS